MVSAKGAAFILSPRIINEEATALSYCLMNVGTLTLSDDPSCTRDTRYSDLVEQARGKKKEHFLKFSPKAHKL